MAEDDWIEFDGGSTVGQRGSEHGTTIQDEEHPNGARITLERDARIAPFAITCGIYGWMVHTRFFRDHADALREYEQMKASITTILSRISGVSDDDDRHQMSQISDAIEGFVKMYP
jgi:hypothetical protein